MVAAIRQVLTVQEDGRIEVRSPELRPGAVAEVIVLLDPSPSDVPTGHSPQTAAMWDRLQQSLKLDAKAASAWIDMVRAERAAFPRVGRTPGTAGTAAPE